MTPMIKCVCPLPGNGYSNDHTLTIKKSRQGAHNLHSIIVNLHMALAIMLIQERRQWRQEIVCCVNFFVV